MSIVKKTHLACASLAILLLAGGCSKSVTGNTDSDFLEELSRRSFDFLWRAADPQTGLVSDRGKADGSGYGDVASLASTGFALAALPGAVERGWIGREAAEERACITLKSALETVPHERGFLVHFVDKRTGQRVWQSEYSPIDTAFFVAGALAVRSYFGGETGELATQVYERIDWPWMMDGGQTLRLAWKPEEGFSRWRWDQYSEAMVMFLLALGSETHPLPPESWNAWRRIPVEHFSGFTYATIPPLFIHQFSHAFVDFSGRRDAHADYWLNSKLATLAQRDFCASLQDEFPAWGPDMWGLTASDHIDGYHAWGGPPIDPNYPLDGSLVPCAPAGSLPFAPEECTLVLRNMKERYGDRIWTTHGFVDAFNPQTGWTNPDVIGIDVGITTLMIQNLQDGIVWRHLMAAPELQRAMALAGLLRTGPAGEDEKTAAEHLSRKLWSDARLAGETTEDEALALGSVLAGMELGLVSRNEAAELAAESLARLASADADEDAAGQVMAALLATEAVFPEMEKLPELMARWSAVNPPFPTVAATDRLQKFLRIGLGLDAPESWAAMERSVVKSGPVSSLAPADFRRQAIPGLWLDESGTVASASASNLAWAAVMADGNDRLFAARFFPREVMAKDGPLPEDPRLRRMVFIEAANIAINGGLRAILARHPAVQKAKSLIPEFTAPPFGQRISLFDLSALRAVDLNGGFEPL